MPSIPVAVAASFVLTLHPRIPFTLIAGLFVLPVTRRDPSADARRLPRTSCAPSIREAATFAPTSVRCARPALPACEKQSRAGFSRLTDGFVSAKSTCSNSVLLYDNVLSMRNPGNSIRHLPLFISQKCKKTTFPQHHDRHFYYVTSYNMRRYWDPISTPPTPFPASVMATPFTVRSGSAGGSRTHNATTNRSLRVRLPVP
ncbi:hypothetical protein R54767_03806 [Paraburkholderia gardini]|uniref:Uncharacterized protein n=1 Tax=Paraburkholderia gardini TaxID=2823469 RepID=A0ABN7QTK5_9BURK|nr:hypothetical protein R54767_03806 [Paraburkholderia gardini]